MQFDYLFYMKTRCTRYILYFTRAEDAAQDRKKTNGPESESGWGQEGSAQRKWYPYVQMPGSGRQRISVQQQHSRSTACPAPGGLDGSAASGDLRSSTCPDQKRVNNAGQGGKRGKSGRERRRNICVRVGPQAQEWEHGESRSWSAWHVSCAAKIPASALPPRLSRHQRSSRKICACRERENRCGL